MNDDKPKEPWRANYVPAPHFFNLNQACTLINKAFGGTCYLVGSSLVRRDYRDVDVRMIMDDDAYAKVFGDATQATINPLWSLVSSAVSLWLSQQSGLSVDFQVQQMTLANLQHAGKRHFLGLYLDPHEANTGRDGK